MKKKTQILEEEFKQFDEKKSVLPKWLLKKGIGCIPWDIYEGKEYLKSRLMEAEKENNYLKFLFQQAKDKFDKNLYRRFYKEFGWKSRSNQRDITELKKQIKEFNIRYFVADDVEKIFRDILDKYELVDKSRIIHPRPQDIGKKRYYCVKCNRRFWTKKKPKKCYGRCDGRKFQRYSRL